MGWAITENRKPKSSDYKISTSHPFPGGKRGTQWPILKWVALKEISFPKSLRLGLAGFRPFKTRWQKTEVPRGSSRKDQWLYQAGGGTLAGWLGCADGDAAMLATRISPGFLRTLRGRGHRIPCHGTATGRPNYGPVAVQRCAGSVSGAGPRCAGQIAVEGEGLKARESSGQQRGRGLGVGLKAKKR